MDRNYDYNRALIAEATGYTGVSNYSTSNLSSSSPASYTTMDGRSRLVYDHKLNKLNTERLDPAQEVLHRCAQYDRERQGRFQEEIDALLASVASENPPQPQPTTELKECNSNTSSPESSPKPSPRANKKEGEAHAGYLGIPRRGVRFDKAKCAGLRQYFAVLRRRKLMVFNSEAEYDQSKGVSGTRASHLLPGCQCRVADGTEGCGFKIKFATGGDWVTFWAPSRAEAQYWVQATLQHAQE